MLGWFVETTLVGAVLAFAAWLAGRSQRIGPAGRHVLWLVVLVKLLTPPVVSWPRGLTGEKVKTCESACSPASAAFDCGMLPEQPLLAGGGSTGVIRDARILDVEVKSPEPACDGVGSPVEMAAMDGALMMLPEPLGFERSAGSEEVVGAGAALLAGRGGPRQSAGVLVFADASRAVLVIWGLGSALAALLCAWRVARFEGRIRGGRPAPEWLQRELDLQSRRLGVRVPSLTVVSGIGTPLVWCLGRARLVVPARLLETLDRERWRGVLVHELAHLKRGDAWVGRALVLAELIWWWNPLFWLVRARLENEAELACDAWVVAACPEGRRSYAEALIDVCALMSRRGSRSSLTVMPALGVGMGGAGRFFERRLKMILWGEPDHDRGQGVRLAALLLAALALPSWTQGQDEARRPDAPRANAPQRPVPPVPPEPPLPPEIGDDDEEGDVAPARARARERIERARADVARRREQLRARRSQVEDQLRRAEAQYREAQEQLQVQMKELQERLQSEMRSAADRMKELEGEARKSGEEILEGPEAEKLAEELKELGREIEVDVKEAMKDVPDAVKEVMKEVPGVVREAMKEVPGALREAMRELERAQREVEEAGRRTGRAERRAGEESDDLAPEIRARRSRRPVPADARPAARRSNEQLERRLEALEERFGALMEELRGLREELRARGEGDRDEDEADVEDEEGDEAVEIEVE
jgi:beta-lactamase regulating signal transducer with metallopeptidase domain